MEEIRVGDIVVCVEYPGNPCGIVVKQYRPTACAQQTMIKCNDGRLFHAPTSDFRKIDEEERLLEERKLNAKRIKVKAERVINKAPVRMQRIIRFKVMQGLTWDSVAIKMGGRCTKDSVRMEFQNWMKEK